MFTVSVVVTMEVARWEHVSGVPGQVARSGRGRMGGRRSTMAGRAGHGGHPPCLHPQIKLF